MLSVVPEQSQLDQATNRGFVVVRSTTTDRTNFSAQIEELSSVNARNLALKYAAQNGITPPRINGNPSSPYAVNAEGDALEDVKDPETKEALPIQHPKMQPAEYRINIPVCGSIG